LTYKEMISASSTAV